MLTLALIINDQIHAIEEIDAADLNEVYEKYRSSQLQYIDITNDTRAIQEGWPVVDGEIQEPIVKLVDELKADKLNSLYQSFCIARDAVVWANGYGYDAHTEDVTNLLAVKDILRDMLVTDPSATLDYKVYKPDGTKEMIPHTLNMFISAQQAGRDQQLTAYDHFEDLRTQVAAAATESDLEVIQW